MQKGNTLTTKILGIFNPRALSGKAGSKMAMWKCGLCVGFAALVLSQMLSHIRQVHSGDKDFKITCGILNCEKSYTKYGSFYRHVKNQHHTYLDIPATYLNTDEISTALRGPNGNEQIFQESYPEELQVCLLKCDFKDGSQNLLSGWGGEGGGGDAFLGAFEWVVSFEALLL